jgi:hypothetical protein
MYRSAPVLVTVNFGESVKKLVEFSFVRHLCVSGGK